MVSVLAVLLEALKMALLQISIAMTMLMMTEEVTMVVAVVAVVNLNQ